MKIPSYIQTIITALLTKYFVYVLSTIVVVIGAVGYFTLIKPQFENVQLVGVLAYQNASDQLFNRQQYLTKVTGMVNQYKSVVAAQAVDVNDIIPTKIDNSTLFQTLQALAEQAGMSATSMAISKGNAVTTGTTAGQATGSRTTSTLTSSSGTVKTIDVQLTVTGPGDYEAYKRFLTAIERSMRLFDLSSIAFTPASAATGTTGPAAQVTLPSISVELTTYYLDQAKVK